MKQLQSFLRPAMLQALLLGSTLIFTGCVGALPFPQFSNRPIHGTILRTRDTAFIHPGTTSASEVFGALGTDCVYDSLKRAVAYSWELPGGQGIWWFATTESGAAGDFEWTRWRGFFVAFDNNDVVIAASAKHLSSRKTLHEHLYAWARKHHAAPGHVVSGARSPGNGTRIPPASTAAAWAKE